MAWQDEQPPWGKGGRPQSPEDFIAELLKKLKSSFGGGGSNVPPGDGEEGTPRPTGGSPSGPFAGKSLILIAILVFVLWQVVSASWFTIKPGERGVVLRFGEYSKTADPGLNFKIPLVDEVIKVDVKEVLKEEFGFRTRRAGQRTQYEKHPHRAAVVHRTLGVCYADDVKH